MEKTFSPQEAQERWYQTWLQNDTFAPQGQGEPYTIVIPPPNVTGALHMGHALNNTIQDVLIRYKRKKGYRALWIPGTDHAGIATQSVVEKQLAKENLTRQMLGREKFVERVWAWKEEYGNRILEQLRQLGSSCDWNRTRFTLDPGLSQAVREVFIRLYNDGLIYHGVRLINWCPQLQTALADEEVETRDTPGKFYHLRYYLEDQPDQYIVVSTTRPETLFGDTAVAVNPEDTRYQHLIGKKVKLPFINRSIPIIADEHANPEKGSGAVKITPAHDANDFAVAQRHQLPLINVMNADATLNHLAGPFAGLKRFECRDKLIAELKELGQLEGEEDRITPIPYCYRTGDVIEPRLMGQWFVKMKPLAEPALASVREGRTRFVPERYAKTYFEWLEGFRDWCISRQIWWGHRIPAWWVVSQTGGQRTSETPVVVARTEEEAQIQAQQKYGPSCVLCQEEDVLDTWFSSALWPFSTLGWPNNTDDLKTYYPTSVLVTARDIIYFWVARMMFSGLKYMGQEPFHTVYINGTVLDARGQRMSKSKGNGIDPLEMIAQYGADAVRFSLLTLTTEGQDIKLAPTKFEMGRNFANKIWNAVRFVKPHLEELRNQAPARWDAFVNTHSLDFTPTDPALCWILSELEATRNTVEKSLDEYRFAEACLSLYHFLWDDFCSRFLEVQKSALTASTFTSARENSLLVFAYVLRRSMNLLHPFMPFLTEEINVHLGFTDLLITSSWPTADTSAQFSVERNEFNQAFSIVEALRTLRGAYNLPPAREMTAVYISDSKKELSPAQVKVVCGLEKLSSLTHGPQASKPAWSAGELAQGGQVYVELTGLLDPVAEKTRLSKELEKTKSFVSSLERKLQNEQFVSNAPAEVIAYEREKLQNQQDRLQKLSLSILELEKLA